MSVVGVEWLGVESNFVVLLLSKPGPFAFDCDLVHEENNSMRYIFTLALYRRV